MSEEREVHVSMLKLLLQFSSFSVIIIVIIIIATLLAVRIGVAAGHDPLVIAQIGVLRLGAGRRRVHLGVVVIVTNRLVLLQKLLLLSVDGRVVHVLVLISAVSIAIFLVFIRCCCC